MRRNTGVTQEFGFTIVELVAVMVIVGIIAAISAPRFVGVDAFDARGSYSTLTAALRYAQKTAIAQRTTVCADINTSTKVVTLTFRANSNTACSSAATGTVIDPATQESYSKTLSSNVTISASTNPIGFDGLGKPKPNATATFTIQNAVVLSESTRTITVEQDTGYVR